MTQGFASLLTVTLTFRRYWDPHCHARVHQFWPEQRKDYDEEIIGTDTSEKAACDTLKTVQDIVSLDSIEDAEDADDSRGELEVLNTQNEWTLDIRARR